MRTLQETIDQVLGLSNSDACIVIAQRVASVNIRWAHNTVTTNGDAVDARLTVISIAGRKVGSVTRTYFPSRAARGGGARVGGHVRAPP